jgi:hypothetical protein
MEGMVHDLQLARETQSSFESWRSQGGAVGTPAGCDIAVSVRAAPSCRLAHITTCHPLLQPSYPGASWWPVLG